jgi:LysR family cyn operon transcriptional activator
MELRHLRYFVAIVDAGSMALASRQVFVTQSTLSHQLAQLEEELGCQLFERVGRTLRLTEAGQALLGHARGALAQVDEGRQAVQTLAAAVSGMLRVGVIHSFVTGLMPEVVAGCLSAHPELRVQVAELTATEIEAQVADGLLDLGVSLYPCSRADVMGERLFEDRLMLAVHPGHRLARRKQIRFAELADVPVAMLTPRYATRRLLDTYFQGCGIRAKVVAEIESVAALQRLVRIGGPAAFMPARMADSAEGLHLLELVDPPAVRAAGLVWRRSNYRSAAAVAFADQVAQALKVQPVRAVGAG